VAKLTGAKKTAFLKRMALGRRKAATRGTKTVKKTRTVKRKSVTTKRKTTPLRRAAPRKRTMVKRRSRTTSVRRRSSKAFGGIGSSLKTGVIGDITRGIGTGSLVTLVMSRVAPNSSITPIAATGAAFLSGGIIGGAANLILTGGLSQLGGMFGGASTPQQEFGV
jgi:hypothetical protein